MKINLKDCVKGYLKLAAFVDPLSLIFTFIFCLMAKVQLLKACTICLSIVGNLFLLGLLLIIIVYRVYCTSKLVWDKVYESRLNRNCDSGASFVLFMLPDIKSILLIMCKFGNNKSQEEK